VTAGDGRTKGKAAEEKAKWKTEFYAARYSNMQKGTFFPFVLCAGDAGLPARAGRAVAVQDRQAAG
jgi:hypothetical protein